MGGNGSRGRGLLNSELGRNWKTVATIGKIQVVQLKDQSKSNKLPEESHTANRIYAIFEKMALMLKLLLNTTAMVKRFGKFTRLTIRDWERISIYGKTGNQLKAVKLLLLATQTYWRFLTKYETLNKLYEYRFLLHQS